MGVPVFIRERPYAVLCPVASRIPALRYGLHPLVMLAANQAHRQLIAERTGPDQRIEVIDEESPAEQDGSRRAPLPGWHLTPNAEWNDGHRRAAGRARCRRQLSCV